MTNEQNKVVIFPKMFERIVARGFEAIETGNFFEAIEFFQQALQFQKGDERILSAYAHSLYEVERYDEAKDVCEALLELPPRFYLEALELYLTVNIQLKDYQKVEKLLETLYDDPILSNQEKERLKAIEEINAEYMARDEYKKEAHVEPLNFILDEEFIHNSLQEQFIKVQQISEMNIRPYVQTIKWIIEHGKTNPFIKSLLLIVLVEQEVDMELEIEKFGLKKRVNPVALSLPTNLPMYQTALSTLVALYEDNPTKLELLQHVLTKHAIVAYPFEWAPYTTDEVAIGYENFVNEMFGESTDTDCAIMGLIQHFEKLSELE